MPTTLLNQPPRKYSHLYKSLFTTSKGYAINSLVSYGTLTCNENYDFDKEYEFLKSEEKRLSHSEYLANLAIYLRERNLQANLYMNDFFNHSKDLFLSPRSGGLDQIVIIIPTILALIPKAILLGLQVATSTLAFIINTLNHFGKNNWSRHNFSPITAGFAAGQGLFTGLALAEIMGLVGSGPIVLAIVVGIVGCLYLNSVLTEAYPLIKELSDSLNYLSEALDTAVEQQIAAFWQKNLAIAFFPLIGLYAAKLVTGPTRLAANFITFFLDGIAHMLNNLDKHCEGNMKKRVVYTGLTLVGSVVLGLALAVYMAYTLPISAFLITLAAAGAIAGTIFTVAYSISLKEELVAHKKDIVNYGTEMVSDYVTKPLTTVKNKMIGGDKESYTAINAETNNRNSSIFSRLSCFGGSNPK